jgi:hypothetical protein
MKYVKEKNTDLEIAYYCNTAAVCIMRSKERDVPLLYENILHLAEDKFLRSRYREVRTIAIFILSG